MVVVGGGRPKRGGLNSINASKVRVRIKDTAARPGSENEFLDQAAEKE